MVNKVFSLTFALALLLVQVTHAQYEGRSEVQNAGAPQVQNSGAPQVQNTGSSQNQGADRPIPMSPSHHKRASHAQHEGRSEVQNAGAPQVQNSGAPQVQNAGSSQNQGAHRPIPMSPSHHKRASHAQHEGRSQMNTRQGQVQQTSNQPINTGPDPHQGSQHTTHMSPTHNGRASSPLRATHNTMYDDPDGSMDTVACSNGENGLGTKYKTFGSVPSYPFIGGVHYDISGPSSPNCGSCWIITNQATGLSIQMTSIDTSDVGFDLTTQAFSELTNGNLTVQEIDVVAKKLSASPCS